MWPFHVCILGAFPPLVEQWRHQNGGRGSNAVAARPRAEESGGRCQTAHASERTGRWCTPEAPSFLLKACRGFQLQNKPWELRITQQRNCLERRVPSLKKTYAVPGCPPFCLPAGLRVWDTDLHCAARELRIPLCLGLFN